MSPSEPNEPRALARRFRSLKEKRSHRKSATGKVKRTRLSPDDRRRVRRKTSGRCHICGGDIDRDKWHADHVLAASTGGSDSVENYLPAHDLCNNYRWNYLPEEFQYILKLGVWAKTHIEKEDRLGEELARKFLAHEARRRARRKKGQ